MNNYFLEWHHFRSLERAKERERFELQDDNLFLESSHITALEPTWRDEAAKTQGLEDAVIEGNRELNPNHDDDYQG